MGVGAVVRRGQPHRVGFAGAGAAVAGADRPWAELVEREAASQVVAGDVLDAVELGLLVGVGGLLPGPGALEGEPALAQQPAQAFTTDPDRSGASGVGAAVSTAGEVGGEFAHAPLHEGQPVDRGAGLGRRDDELEVDP